MKKHWDRAAMRLASARYLDRQGMLDVTFENGDHFLVAEESVLRRLRAGNHNLLVMGVSPRPGESLAFGHVAAAVLARSEHSILFVSS